MVRNVSFVWNVSKTARKVRCKLVPFSNRLIYAWPIPVLSESSF